nr:MAG TPA: hypothetical protein [Caudoviricetes sp.]
MFGSLLLSLVTISNKSKINYEKETTTSPSPGDTRYVYWML